MAERARRALWAHWRLGRLGGLRAHPGRRACWARREDERGAVTAELAMGLPLLLALTVGLFWMLTLAADQVRVQDAATQIARAVARGDDQARAVSHALEIAPPGAEASVSQTDAHVRVVVTARTRSGSGLLAHVGSVSLQAHATALLEEPPGGAVAYAETP